MTCLQFAKDECSNFRTVCVGITFDATGRQVRMKELANKPCVLREDKPCSFFEDFVLPLAKSRAKQEKGAAPYIQTVKEYNKIKKGTCE